MRSASHAREAGAILGGVALLGGIVALGFALLMGMTAFSIWVLEWTFPAFLIALAVTALLVPTALIPASQGFAAVGFMIASMALGAIVWLWGLSYTYEAWGFLGVVIGLVILGVGVVPIAMLAALFHGDWGNLGLFAAAMTATYGVRSLSLWLADKADERSASHG